MFIWLSLVSLLVSIVTVPVLIKFLSANGITKKNYKQETIPVGTGLIFPWAIVTSVILLSLSYRVFGGEDYLSATIPLVALVLGSALIGFIDDRLSDDKVRGVFNHLKKLIGGKLTSGGIKAIFGLLISFYVSLTLFDELVTVVINALIIAFSMNSMNLLDLRPGRALKAYISVNLLLLFVPLVLRNALPQIFHFQLALIMPAIALLPNDSQGNSMLGDTGSNIMGSIIGFTIVSQGWSMTTTIFVLIALVLFNLVADRWSISKFIENVSQRNAR